MRSTRWCTCLVLIAWPFAAGASVSLKNGNFFIGYTDITYDSQGISMNLERVYNSKTPFSGIFGVGWGTAYEVYITRIGDGSLVVHEHGGGAENSFFPRNPSPELVTSAIEALGVAYHSEKPAASVAELDSYRAHLKTDARWRAEEWERLREKKLLEEAPAPPDGQELVSDQFSHQVIKRVGDRYQRRNDNGTVETFDDNGHLIEIADRNHNHVAFGYQDSIASTSCSSKPSRTGCKLTSLKDNFNHEITLSYDTDTGLVTSAVGSGSKTAHYRYNRAREMTEAKDADGNIYHYQWSADGRHDLISVGYADGTAMSIWYYPVEISENVRAVRDGDGTLTHYRYEPTPVAHAAKPPDTYAVIVEVEQRGHSVGRSRYEYHEKTGPAGNRYIVRMSSDVDGDRTDTSYASNTGLPLRIVHNKDVTRFEYDDNGHVTLKQTPQGETRLSYGPCEKVTRVGETVRNGKPKAPDTWSSFEYDPSTCNLRMARNSEGDQVELSYYPDGQIREALRNQKTLRFTYNRDGRPTRIEVDQVGAIDVTYTPSGEIEKVDSSGGRRISLEVTSLFQSLLEIIRPSGVQLLL
jgi:uncharacterized protein DUF6531